jgi:diguanylate cyclase (GGDEF)-like protein
MRKNDSGYRYGGDEFTAILPMTHGSEAVTVAERIRQEFYAAKFIPEPGQNFEATVSIGITERNQEEGWEELTKRADRAMYAAKKEGGNRTCLL